MKEIASEKKIAGTRTHEGGEEGREFEPVGSKTAGTSSLPSKDCPPQGEDCFFVSEELKDRFRANALYVLGMQHWKLGDIEEAIPYFEEASDLGHAVAGEMLSRCRRALRSAGQGYLL